MSCVCQLFFYPFSLLNTSLQLPNGSQNSWPQKAHLLSKKASDNGSYLFSSFSKVNVAAILKNISRAPGVGGRPESISACKARKYTLS